MLRKKNACRLETPEWLTEGTGQPGVILGTLLLTRLPESLNRRKEIEKGSQIFEDVPYHCTKSVSQSLSRTVQTLKLPRSCGQCLCFRFLLTFGDLTICSAAEDITNSSQVQNALQDLVDIRHAKIRTGLHSMSMGPAPAVKVHLVYFVSFFYCLLQFLHLLTESAEWHFCHGA